MSTAEIMMSMDRKRMLMLMLLVSFIGMLLVRVRFVRMMLAMVMRSVNVAPGNEDVIRLGLMSLMRMRGVSVMRMLLRSRRRRSAYRPEGAPARAENSSP